ncbi:MAG: phenylalanine--tRNA ligase subunit beta [Actinomycetota bacterium]
MRVPVSWLREFCATLLSPEELADRLTLQGVEVEAILRPWEKLAGVSIARVLDVRDHPKADRLCLSTIDAGAGERQVVVGVRNMTPGDLVAYAAPGATVPGVEGVLERREIRGVISDGMICSAKELGISHDHSGILVLPDGADPGQDLKAHLGLDDAVLDVQVFPNRPDLFSVVGVARELAAATGEEFRMVEPNLDELEEKATDAAAVDVRDRAGCPRFVIRVIRGVKLGASPLQAQIRLSASGMRPLANVVDATNYVMLETGQPLHAFDLERVAGGRLIVRRADEGEVLVTLDGEKRTFAPGDLLVTDDTGALGVAGVIGGQQSEVSEVTTNVLLECASWEPVSILRTARRLGLRTEASIRFERGVDPEAPPAAAAQCAGLIAAWSGGGVLAGAIDVGGAPDRRKVAFRPARASRLLGLEVSAGEAVAAFERLRIPAKRSKNAVTVEVPGYRVDLEREADLVEEVARVGGYERIPSTLPGIRQAGGLSRDQRLGRRLRDVLVRAGLVEAWTSSFAPASDPGLFEDGRARPIRIANPVADDEAFLRTSLLPGLMRTARRNVAHRRLSVRLFEVGAIFHADEPMTESEHVAVVLTGAAEEEWPREERELDVLDAKGVLDHLLRSLGVSEWILEPPAGRPFHPSRSAGVLVGGKRIGEVGEMHPAALEPFDLTGPVAALELLVRPLIENSPGVLSFQEISRFPPVHRDLAFLVGEDVRADEVRLALVEAGGPLLDRVLLFDVFEGGPLPEGKRSLAFSLDFRALDRTLTDEEVEGIVREISERLAAGFGAELRAG